VVIHLKERLERWHHGCWCPGGCQLAEEKMRWKTAPENLKLIDGEARIRKGNSEFRSIRHDIDAQYGGRNGWLFRLLLQWWLLHVSPAECTAQHAKQQQAAA
jgi:hypothetical protein